MFIAVGLGRSAGERLGRPHPAVDGGIGLEGLGGPMRPLLLLRGSALRYVVYLAAIGLSIGGLSVVLPGAAAVAAVSTAITVDGTKGGRSEERRVGKECRSRWAEDHDEKKEYG